MPHPTSLIRPGARRLVLAALALGATAIPVAAAAQQPPEPDLGEAALTRFARAHLAIGQARDDYHGRIGRLHEEQARQQARQELDQRIAEILESEGLTRDAYDRLILIVSTDPETRARFEEILATLAPPGGPGGG